MIAAYLQAPRKALICFGILCLVSLSTHVQGVKTSCRIRTMKQSGLVVCAFSENIAETQQSFVVHRYDLDIKDKVPDQVLQCSWLSAGLDCVLHDGYTFDGNVSSVLLVDIPELSRKTEGRYICQVIGNNDDDDELCELRHTEVMEEEKSTEMPSNLPGNCRNQSYETELNLTICHTWIIVSSICAVVFAGMTFVILWWRCGQKRRIPCVRESKASGDILYRTESNSNAEMDKDKRTTTGRSHFAEDVELLRDCPPNRQNLQSCEEEPVAIQKRLEQSFLRLLDMVDLSVESAVEKRLKGKEERGLSASDGLLRMDSRGVEKSVQTLNPGSAQCGVDSDTSQDLSIRSRRGAGVCSRVLQEDPITFIDDEDSASRCEKEVKQIFL